MISEQKLDNFYHGNDTPQSLGELIDFLSDITERHVHGTRDNDQRDGVLLLENKSEERLKKIRAGYSQLSATCRYVHETTRRLLEGMGIRSREVSFISGLGQERDTRHVVCEVFYDKEPFHVDVDMGVLMSQQLRFLHSLDVKDALTEGRITEKDLWRLTDDKHVDHSTHDYLKRTLNDPNALLSWYRSLATAVVIGGYFYTPDEKAEARIRQDLPLTDQDIIRIPRTVFIERYYPQYRPCQK